MTKWDYRYLELAKHISTWSKDPSTQCGAVIVRPDKTICSLGFNGFPRDLSDNQELYENREEKYSRVIHAEMNALLNSKETIKGYTVYIYPFLSCERCTVHLIQSGINRVVTLESDSNRWSDSFKKSRQLYSEANVDLCELENFI